MNNYTLLCDEFFNKNGDTVKFPIFMSFNFFAHLKLHETCNFVVYVITFVSVRKTLKFLHIAL